MRFWAWILGGAALVLAAFGWILRSKRVRDLADRANLRSSITRQIAAHEAAIESRVKADLAQVDLEQKLERWTLIRQSEPALTAEEFMAKWGKK